MAAPGEEISTTNKHFVGTKVFLHLIYLFFLIFILQTSTTALNLFDGTYK